MKYSKFFLLASLVFSRNSNAELDHLPYSAGPGPLFSFGQNVQKKNGFVYRQIYFVSEADLHTTFLLHNHIYYGITDTLTFVVKQPILAKNFRLGINGRGICNTRLELEFITYEYKIPDECRLRTTILGAMIFPTNTSKIITLQTTKSMNYFAGITESFATPKIFQYMFFGIFVPTSKDYGFLFYCQTGFAHTIMRHDDFYLGVDIEVNVEYQKTHKFTNKPVLALGGTAIYIGPTLRASRDHFIFQIGIQYPCVRHSRPSDVSSRTDIDPTNYRMAFAAAMRF